MKKNGKWLMLIFVLVTCQEGYAQANSFMDEKVLETLLESGDKEKYFDKIAEYGKAALADSSSHTLIELSSYLKKHLGGLTSRERLILRRTAIRLANYTYKLEGYNQEVLNLYLLAHENVSNLNYLDSLSWYAENELCIIYTINGDYEKADYYGSLLDRSLRKYGMQEKLSRFYTNKGRLLKSAYKTSDAIEVFRKGLHYADSIQFTGGILSNALNLAEVYNEDTTLGDPLPYLQTASAMLSQLTSEENYQEKKSTYEIEYGKYLLAKGEGLKGIAHFDTALIYLQSSYLNHHRREFSKFYLAVGEAYYTIDSFDRALIAVDRGIASLMPEYKGTEEALNENQLYADNSISELFHLKSRVMQSLHDQTGIRSYLHKALTCLELGLSVNDQLREFVVADPSKLIGIRINKVMIARSIEILHQLYQEDPNPVYLMKIRSMFNRSKSILYAEKIQNAHLTKHLAHTDREKLLVLQRQLLSLYDSKLATDADLVAINGQILELNEQIEALYSPYRTLKLKIIKPENYIEYVVDEHVVFGLAEFDGLPQFIKIGNTHDLSKLLGRLQEFIALRDLSMDVDILHDLYVFLLKPFAEALPERFVVIPDGAIGFIPFEMMQDDAGNYLIERFIISYAFEYESAVEDTEAGTFGPDYIYCLSPVYPPRPGKKDQVIRGGLYHLPYAKMEIDTISNLFGKNAITSESSMKNEWLENVRKCNVFHYAGHAIIDGELAYLALTADDIISDQLTAHEISLSPQPLDLVVLSACETGLGKLEVGEGIRSLGRSFMEGGTKATVISLWNVNDKSTASIMTTFYKYLKEGNKKDEALRNAKKDYLSMASPKTQHPFYWAAFIPAGDMKPL